MKRITDIRMASQQLSNSHLQTPHDVVSWMGAIQAQDFPMATWAVAIRLAESTNTQVEEAFNTGAVLRTHVLRPTWHLVAPENIRWMLSLSAERIKASSKSRDKDLEITEALYCKTNRLIEKALEGNKHLTRNEVGDALQKANIPLNAARLIHFMMRAEADGIVCSGALKGKKQTYTLLDERVAKRTLPSKEESLARLAQLYFNSHCPATLPDFVWWSGLSQTDAKIGLEAVQSHFISEKIGKQVYWIAHAFTHATPATPSIYLLPAYDEYIISYKDRTAALCPEHHRNVISKQGVFQPTILENGHVIGRWKKSTTKKQALLFDFFQESDVFINNKMDEASRRFSRFIQSESSLSEL
jgi:hypothetical protein